MGRSTAVKTSTLEVHATSIIHFYTVDSTLKGTKIYYYQATHAHTVFFYARKFRPEMCWVVWMWVGVGEVACCYFRRCCRCRRKCDHWCRSRCNTIYVYLSAILARLPRRFSRTKMIISILQGIQTKCVGASPSLYLKPPWITSQSIQWRNTNRRPRSNNTNKVKSTATL
jgi:hypothetical protein